MNESTKAHVAESLKRLREECSDSDTDLFASYIACLVAAALAPVEEEIHKKDERIAELEAELEAASARQAPVHRGVVEIDPKQLRSMDDTPGRGGGWGMVFDQDGDFEEALFNGIEWLVGGAPQNVPFLGWCELRLKGTP